MRLTGLWYVVQMSMIHDRSRASVDGFEAFPKLSPEEVFCAKVRGLPITYSMLTNALA